MQDPALKANLLDAYERVVAKCARYRPACDERVLRGEVARAIMEAVRTGQADTKLIELEAFWWAACDPEQRIADGGYGAPASRDR